MPTTNLDRCPAACPQVLRLRFAPLRMTRKGMWCAQDDKERGVVAQDDKEGGGVR